MNLNPKNKTGLGEQVSIGMGKTCTKELVQIPIGMSILVYVRVSTVEFYLLERKKKIKIKILNNIVIHLYKNSTSSRCN